ncbi:MAG: acyltransferase family protein [Hyphomicrobiaceae bacterium]
MRSRVEELEGEVSMASVNPSEGYRRDIDGLRALAVLPVVLSHAGIAGFSGGFIGVDIFFIISGFLITGILIREIEAGTFSLIRFYERRVRRILPALFAMLAAVTVAGWFFLTPDRYVAFARSAIATIAFVSNVWFWRATGDYFGSTAELEPLLHTWSLAVEEQFYIVFPLLLWLVATRTRPTRIAIIVTLAIGSFALSVWATHAEPVANFFLAPMRSWELGIGALLALGVIPAKAPRPTCEVAAALGLALILASITLITPATPFPGLAALPPCLGAGLIIWACGQHTTAVGRLLSTPVPVWFGLISYSLYLWHWPLLVALKLSQNTTTLATHHAWAVVALAITLAYASWRFVEQPFRRRGSSTTTSRIFPASLAGATALLAAASVIVIQRGFTTRLPATVQATFERAVRRSDIEIACMKRSRPVQDGLCRVGSNTKHEPDMLIWGDSHAAAMLPGFEIWLDRQGRSAAAAVKSACPPLLHIVRTDQGNRHRCDAFNDAVITYLERHTAIRTVVLAARWALAAEGTRAPGETGSPALLGRADSATTTPAVANNLALFSYGMAETVRRLTAMDRQVLILGGVPEIGFSAPQAHLAQAFFARQPSNPPDFAAIQRRNANADAAIKTVASKFGASQVSIARLMCQPACRTQDGGTIFYRDDDHLSIAGARQFVPLALDLALK